MKNQSPQGGRIINNGSISAYTPRPDAVAYTATKHAITGLTKQISLDGRKYNIACSQVDVGNAATPMTARMQGGVLQANGETMAEPTFNVEHVGETVLYISNLPLDANIQFAFFLDLRLGCGSLLRDFLLQICSVWVVFLCHILIPIYVGIDLQKNSL